MGNINFISFLKLRFFLSAVLAAALCTFVVSSSADAGIIPFGSGVNQFNMDFVEIGSPGNTADTADPVGAVLYVYQLGKFEVSRDMIAKAEGTLGMTLNTMGFVTGGPRADTPATGVSWNEAARFVNWLNTSTGNQAAYKFTTGGPNDNISLWINGDVALMQRIRSATASRSIFSPHLMNGTRQRNTTRIRTRISTSRTAVTPHRLGSLAARRIIRQFLINHSSKVQRTLPTPVV